MCGIAGQLRVDGNPVERDRLLDMAQAIAHRGPDHQGIWVDGPVGLAHRRLSIVDLSDAASQPMERAGGSLVITFNGEIYNYQDLRHALEAEGVRFRTTSDTEVLLELYARHGEHMLEKLHGMFAFAIWDAPKKKLFFARDRIGKKPFFYRQDAQGFQFASEIKALLIGSRPSADWSAVRSFLGLQYVPSPQTGFMGVASLPPAHAGTVENGSLRIWRYDELKRGPKFEGSIDEAAKEVRRRLEEAVRLRLIADVPVGAFLSGGIDSTALVSLMARQSSSTIQTFTMGFPSFGFDERAQARETAARIGTEHHEFEAQPGSVAELVDTLVDLYDAPYADSSSLPTWLLARETRKSVKAVVTGDGGDELFGGYRRYQAMVTAVSLRHPLVGGATAWAAEAMGRLSGDPRFHRFSRTVRAYQYSYGQGYGALFTGSYFSEQELAGLLRPDFLHATEDADAQGFIASQIDEALGAECGLAFDLHSYLPDDLNVKMDRATMAHGLEARAPFLDQELVRFAARLPLPMVLKRGTQKPVLQAAIRDLVPADVFRRPKRGFQVPLAEWFRGDLRPMFVDRCLSDGSPLLKICRKSGVETYLQENDRGSNHGNRLWMLLVLATWLQRYG